MATIALQSLAKSFGSLNVIDNIDLDIADGEFVVLVGPSGCGKSTTLRMLAGLETPSAGRIAIGGRDVTNLPPGERDVAMVFQNYALYPHMTVAQNMSFALRLRGMTKPDIEKRVLDAARILHIEPLLDRKPKQLSGGQRQRVAMGRAIVRAPVAFLFDEPLSNLDAQLRGHMRVEIALLQKRLRGTTVYVTHDQVEAMTLADRIVIFENGKIQQVGTPEDVFERPANLFVAKFIGSPTMNILSGRLAPSGEAMLVGAGAVSIPSALRDVLRNRAGHCVAIGLRPQALHLKPDTSEGFEIDIDVVEYLGTETVVVGKLSALPDTPVTVVLPGRQGGRGRDRMRVSASPEDWHVFDTETGKNLAAA